MNVEMPDMTKIIPSIRLNDILGSDIMKACRQERTKWGVIMKIESNPRSEILINRNWTFSFGDIPEAADPDYDDSGWHHVGIPHSFEIPTFMENHFYVGFGCYRKWIDLPSDLAGMRVRLEFLGVFQEIEVWLNGRPAGRHQGGYTSFVVDLDGVAVPGRNLLFCRVNNRWNPQLAPRAGEHVFHGGIYRDVRLLLTDAVHVAWHGTFVRTEALTPDGARLRLDTEVENDSKDKIVAKLVSTVEHAGAVAFETVAVAEIASGGSWIFEQAGRACDPVLWHPDSPHLYRLVTRLFVDGRLRDEVETPFGIRTIRFDAEHGFFLNGSRLELLGANVHQDHAGWGDAVTHAGIRRDVGMIKACGMNFIRGSHYPHHPVFASECDRQGLLFWSELCFWGIGGFAGEGYWNASAYPVNEEDQEPFEESCVRMLEEMIRTHRNHPSVIAWSLGNEVFFSRKDVLEKARRLVVRLAAVSRFCDPSRPAASGGAQRGGFDRLADIAGYNGDGAVLFRNPGIPSLVTEYGSVISDRPGAFDPAFTDGVRENPEWRCGKAIWCGFHHGSIADRMGHMGFIDHFRLPLRGWHWYRKALLGIEPPEAVCIGKPAALRLETDATRIGTDGTDDAQIRILLVDADGIRVDAEAEVVLRVTGGALFPTGRTYRLHPGDGRLVEGVGAIELRAFHAGAVLVEAEAVGADGGKIAGARLLLTADGEERWSNQPLDLQAGPPSAFVPTPSDELRDLAWCRPVFCSSHREGFSPGSISDDSPEPTGWRPDDEAGGHWIMQDLEGQKRIASVRIAFGAGEAAPVEVLLSADGARFDLLARITPAADGEACEWPVGGIHRYVKIRFPTRPMPVLRLEVRG